MGSEEEEKTEFRIDTVIGAKAAPFPSFLTPMLATPAEKAFTREGWIYEPKLDGMRALAMVNGDKVDIFSRTGKTNRAQYPALAANLLKQCKAPVVLDGEIVALNSEGKPSFQLLQQRMNLLKVLDITRAENRVPVHYLVFDIIYADGFSLVRTPLRERKRVLNHYLIPDQRIAILNYFEDDGVAAYEASIENGFEGIVAKRIDSFYDTGRRSPSWVKIKAVRSDEFLIAGYSIGQGSRNSTFGSLVLAYYDEENRLIYAGSVGSGFDQKLLDALLKKMEPLKISNCPLLVRPEDKKLAIWVKPELVAEIKYMDWTEDKHLRNPVFLHLRSDIDPTQVRISHTLASKSSEQIETGTRQYELHNSDLKVAEADSTTWTASTSSEGEFALSQLKPQIDSFLGQISGKEIKLTVRSGQYDIALTNLNKILFPSRNNLPAITKRDYLKLIATLAPLILPQIAHRPLTMIRAPGGVKGKSFFQKHWHLELPDFLHSAQIKELEPAAKDYLICNNLQSLIFLAQNNILEFHTFLSRCELETRDEAAPADLLNYPDYLVFDIDYHKGGESNTDLLDREAFKKTRDAAFIVKETLDGLKLNSFIKTSGRNGLHVYVPLIPEFTFEEVKTLSETIAKYIEQNSGHLIGTNPVISRNQGKVFLDYHANSKGRSIAVPYTTRITAQATISAPLAWEELSAIYPDEINQYTITQRLATKGDIWKDIWKYREDLSSRFSKRS